MRIEDGRWRLRLRSAAAGSQPAKRRTSKAEILEDNSTPIQLRVLTLAAYACQGHLRPSPLELINIKAQRRHQHIHHIQVPTYPRRRNASHGTPPSRVGAHIKVA